MIPGISGTMLSLRARLLVLQPGWLHPHLFVVAEIRAQRRERLCARTSFHELEESSLPPE
jgi:hypothetical protein